MRADSIAAMGTPKPRKRSSSTKKVRNRRDLMGLFKVLANKNENANASDKIALRPSDSEP